MVDVVPEGEEGVRRDGHALERLEEILLLSLGQRLGHLFEFVVKLFLFDVSEIALDVPHSAVDAVLPLDALLELQSHHLRVLTKIPCGDFASGEFDAVDSALLAGPDADHLAVEGVAHRVGLGVLDAYRRQNGVVLLLGRKVLAVSDDVLEFGSVEECVVSLLHEAHAVDVTELQRRGRKRRVSLQYDEFAALLGLEDLQSLLVIPRCDDAVADFRLEHQCGLLVHHVTQRSEVAEGAHRVGIPRTHVRTGRVRELLVADVEHLTLHRRQRGRDGRPGRRHVLE
mmetsp:Transcript_53887/g.135412  ORF Transcript_53887/g.135412 Transcript_53887/m.135412 type:complete len:284 (+) Transcript_53887:1169-2020(+)